ncbi:hypothetical protein J43TS9_20600 [Paenibacillus cineris]|nr:hypothetical protein J43TS9_20600 [Paenibacillus cineris]
MTQLYSCALLINKLILRRKQNQNKKPNPVWARLSLYIINVGDMVKNKFAGFLSQSWHIFPLSAYH